MKATEARRSRGRHGAAHRGRLGGLGPGAAANQALLGRRGGLASDHGVTKPDEIRRRGQAFDDTSTLEQASILVIGPVASRHR